MIELAKVMHGSYLFKRALSRKSLASGLLLPELIVPQRVRSPAKSRAGHINQSPVCPEAQQIVQTLRFTCSDGAGRGIRSIKKM